jgi:hypothetical protein
MKLFERSSKDSAILRRDFQKNAGKSRSFAQHDTRAGGVADDDVALLNHAHDAVLPLSAQKRHAKRTTADDAAPRGVMKITGAMRCDGPLFVALLNSQATDSLGPPLFAL